jgi:hypothetical protein
MLHWGQGTTFKALAHLIAELRARERGAGGQEMLDVAGRA